MANPLRQFDITEDEITQVVTVFYARVRKDPDLGPVFGAHIAPAEWPAHEAKIVRFWSNAILRTRNYSGNPMQVHMSASDVQAEHFPVWLGLFDTVLAERLPEATACAWSALAHRISKGFLYGLEIRKPPGEVPVFS
ncbi:group III truncated hemoglobin [Roseovarius pelagicus]|uniref:Group III truncated hemoglobin n=1 Tax=Roseovarius pelagicus TaxID=2980108 RepID=A0ABY6DMP2_9RHOB|nr:MULTISPECIES: group III truncated hemoglobin [Rhodobacterales]UXX85040.1 group III truncated hemoglobin [Roseovarius pelagicus]